VSVVNPSDSRITIDQEQLQRAFRVTLTAGGTSIPVVATWSDDALVIAPDSDTRDSVSRPDLLNVEGHGGAYWTVTVRRSDGQTFGSGRYKLTWSSGRSGDRDPWRRRRSLERTRTREDEFGRLADSAATEHPGGGAHEHDRGRRCGLAR
jgi:hypothetical protein